MDPLVIESCHSTWVFDQERMRFRRILKGLDLGHAHGHATTGWRPYHGLEMTDGSDNFVVVLNPEGTQLLRSWRHLDGACAYCGQQQTMELSLEQVRAAIHG